MLMVHLFSYFIPNEKWNVIVLCYVSILAHIDTHTHKYTHTQTNTNIIVQDKRNTANTIMVLEMSIIHYHKIFRGNSGKQVNTVLSYDFIAITNKKEKRKKKTKTIKT